MKKLELKTLNVKEGAIAESYKDLAIMALRNVTQQDPITDLEVMGDKLVILNKIKNTPHGGTVELEDAQTRILNRAVQSFPWSIVDEDLYNFRVTVKDLAEAKPIAKVK